MSNALVKLYPSKRMLRLAAIKRFFSTLNNASPSILMKKEELKKALLERFDHHWINLAAGFSASIIPSIYQQCLNVQQRKLEHMEPHHISHLLELLGTMKCHKIFLYEVMEKGIFSILNESSIEKYPIEKLSQMILQGMDIALDKGEEALCYRLFLKFDEIVLQRPDLKELVQQEYESRLGALDIGEKIESSSWKIDVAVILAKAFEIAYKNNDIKTIEIVKGYHKKFAIPYLTNTYKLLLMTERVLYQNYVDTQELLKNILKDECPMTIQLYEECLLMLTSTGQDVKEFEELYKSQFHETEEYAEMMFRVHCYTKNESEVMKFLSNNTKLSQSSFESLVEYYSLMGNEEKAIETIKNKKGYSDTLFTSVQVFASMINLKLAKGQKKEALDIYETIIRIFGTVPVFYAKKYIDLCLELKEYKHLSNFFTRKYEEDYFLKNLIQCHGIGEELLYVAYSLANLEFFESIYKVLPEKDCFIESFYMELICQTGDINSASAFYDLCKDQNISLLPFAMFAYIQLYGKSDRAAILKDYKLNFDPNLVSKYIPSWINHKKAFIDLQGSLTAPSTMRIEVEERISKLLLKQDPIPLQSEIDSIRMKYLMRCSEMLSKRLHEYDEAFLNEIFLKYRHIFSTASEDDAKFKYYCHLIFCIYCLKNASDLYLSEIKTLLSMITTSYHHLTLASATPVDKVGILFILADEAQLYSRYDAYREVHKVFSFTYPKSGADKLRLFQHTINHFPAIYKPEVFASLHDALKSKNMVLDLHIIALFKLGLFSQAVDYIIVEGRSTSNLTYEGAQALSYCFVNAHADLNHYRRFAESWIIYNISQRKAYLIVLKIYLQYLSKTGNKVVMENLRSQITSLGLPEDELMPMLAVYNSEASNNEIAQ